MTARRLRAPATDGGLLAEPPLASAVDEAEANAARLSTWDYDVQGRRASQLRAQVRREVVELGPGVPGPPWIRRRLERPGVLERR